MKRRGVLAAGVGLTGFALVGAPDALAAEAAAPGTGGDTVLRWFDATDAAVQAAKAGTQIVNSRTWALAWLAAARATRRNGRPGFQSAALAAAIHGVLSPSADPVARQAVDTALAAALDRIPEGRAKSDGVRAGTAEAERVLDERAGDGITVAEINAVYPEPADPAPGIWRRTPPGDPAVQYGQRLAAPFLLDRNDRFRPGPPPGLTSARYTNALAEVHAYGRKDSALRTPAQTAVARFWEQASLAGWTGALRAAVAAQHHRSTAARTAFVAAFHLVTLDAQIAVYEAKYVYTRWRPVTAIREGVIDRDPTWEPLTTTPRHPEFPSGHAGFAGAAERVLTAYAGDGPGTPFTLGSPSGVRLTYDRWAQLTRDNVDARVWEGVHFRFSDEIGVQVGESVADWGLRGIARLLH